MSKTQNSKGLVPRLRFPEFQNAGEWGINSFEKTFTRITTKNLENNTNVLTISAQKGLVSQLDYFNKKISAKDVSGYYFLHKGDFAYNKSYSKGYPMGAIKLLKDYDKGVVSTLYICFRANANYSKYFFDQYFDSGLFNTEINKIAQEGGRAHGLLNVSVKEFFKDLNLFVPSYTEQQKIANCLSSLDDLITAHSKKLDALKAHKKGLMQQLFPSDGETTPKLRFPEFQNTGEWEGKKLETFTNSISSGKDKNNAEGIYNLFGSTGIIGKTLNNSLKGDFILVARVVANAGQLNRVSGEFGVTDNTLIIDLKEKENINFIFYLLDKFGLNKMVFGSGQPLITGKQLKSLVFAFPHLKEQQKIANCLSSLDNQITAQSKKIEALKLHKKGLMQQLFPSAEGI